MAGVANSAISSGPNVHVFHELPSERREPCAACREVPAVYCWTKQHEDDLLRGPDQNLCRVCAGMILLVGTTY